MRKYPLIGGKGEICFSFDDYHPLNMKIDEILHKQGIEATFYIETREHAAREQIKELFERGHDIGSHTIHHPSDLKALNSIECMSEIQGSKGMIESITNRPCTSFCYPRGRHNDDVVAMVRKAGFTEARTTHVLKTKYDDLFRIGTTIHLYDGRKEYNGRDFDVLTDFYLDDVKKNGGLLSIWGHAFEMERWGYWDRFEKLVVRLGKHIEA